MRDHWSALFVEAPGDCRLLRDHPSWNSGPKVDKWLVRTVGGLIAAVGASVIMGSYEQKLSRAVRVLGIGSVAALGIADIVYTLRVRIPKVYVGDAAAEAAPIAARRAH